MPSGVKSGPSGSDAEQQQDNTKGNRSQTGDKKEQQPGSEREPDCSKSQSPEDCLVQLWTARATQKQADMAFWGGVVSVLTLIATGIAAGAAIAAVVISAKSATAANLAAAQTGIAADAAVRSANVAEQALRGLERPYLFIEKIDNRKLSPMGGRRMDGKPAIDFTVVNYGKTPGVVRWVALRLQSNPQWPLRLPLRNTKAYYTVVRPETRMTHRGGDDYGTVAVEASTPDQSFRGRQMASLVFQGAIAYEDASGERYIDRFCFRGNVDGESWTIEGGDTHNWRKSFPRKNRNGDSGDT